ncbi:MAG: hypothetical protein ACI81V_001531, partial [Lentimonas sp.]
CPSRPLMPRLLVLWYWVSLRFVAVAGHKLEYINSFRKAPIRRGFFVRTPVGVM